MTRLIMITLASLAMVVAVAGAQTPVEPLDVAVTALDFTFPSPGTVTLTAHLAISSVLTTSTTFQTEVTFLLDGVPASTVQFATNAGGSDCSADPTCSVLCNVQTGAHCGWWTTWLGGGGCDPGDPGNTCAPITICACGFTATVSTSSAYSGEVTATVVYDPVNGVAEADETNNSMSVALAPVPVRHSTWGAIKALFEI